MPRISVILPTYNRSILLQQAIESILEQSYTDYEIIVIDDGSTDDTVSVLNQLVEDIKVIKQPQLGFGGSFARNAGIELADGDLIAFLDSDDEWLPGKLEKQIAFMDAQPGLSWSYTDAEVYDADTGEFKYFRGKKQTLCNGEILERLFLSNFIQTSTVVVKRSVFEDVGPFWPTPKGTDWDMWLRISERYAIGLLPDVLCRYHTHKKTVTQNLSGQEAYSASLKLVDRALKRDSGRLAPLRNRAVARIAMESGMQLASSGHLGQARQMFARAARHTPTNVRLHFYWLATFLGERAFDIAKLIQSSVRRRRGNYLRNKEQ